MTRKSGVKLEDDEVIAAAWAEFPSGPGWSNRLVYVLIRARGGGLRTVALQPDEQTPGMMLLAHISAAAVESMTAEAKSISKTRKR